MKERTDTIKITTQAETTRITQIAAAITTQIDPTTKTETSKSTNKKRMHPKKQMSKALKI